MSLDRRSFLQRTTMGTVGLLVSANQNDMHNITTADALLNPAANSVNSARSLKSFGVVSEKILPTAISLNRVSLIPLDPRCRLFSNLLWTKNERGNPTLSKQHLWVRFPHTLTVKGAILKFLDDIEILRFETSDDEGRTWNILSTGEAKKKKHSESDPTKQTIESSLDPGNPYVFSDADVLEVHWSPVKINNLRVVVEKAVNPSFPMSEYFARLEILCDEEITLPEADSKFIPVTEGSVCLWQPVEGDSKTSIYDRMGFCHRSMETKRVTVSSDADSVTMRSPLMNISFSRHFALVRSLGWDFGGNGREQSNLLSSSNTQGAFPLVGRGMERRSSGVGGGRLEVKGRNVIYQDVSVVPELRQTLSFSVREEGFQVKINWECNKTFRTYEIAALRFPFDLYQTVTNVLAVPNTTGASGLVNLPLVIHAPNHGTMRVTVQEKNTQLPVLGRASPFRVRAELWLDLISGAVPLDNGLFEVPAGKGSVTLNFELTKVFPFSETDIYNWWQRPPSYSFIDRETILGALPNAWLSGLCFRPELSQFANNSVSEAAALCAPFYADVAAYTPELAPGLPATDILKCATDTILLDHSKSAYSDDEHFPMAASATLDLAWLTVASTGDWEWAQKRKEDIIIKAKNLLDREYQKTGLVASSYTGRPADPEFMTATWFDSLRSGHLESFANATIYRAAIRTAELLSRLDERLLSTQLTAMTARTKNNFLQIFFNPHTHRIAQWVDVDGKQYDFDSRTHLASPIVCGLIEGDLARELLLGYLQRLEKTGFNSYMYGLPILLDPVSAVYHNGWMGKGVETDGTDQIGVYMNDSVTHHQMYWLLQALYKVGLRQQANDLFIKITPLARKGGLSGGLHSGVDWRMKDGTPSGYEGLLAEQFQFLLSAITGYLGWELTIDGLKLNSEVVAACSDRVRNMKPNFAHMAGTKIK